MGLPEHWRMNEKAAFMTTYFNVELQLQWMGLPGSRDDALWTMVADNNRRAFGLWPIMGNEEYTDFRTDTELREQISDLAKSMLAKLTEGLGPIATALFVEGLRT